MRDLSYFQKIYLATTAVDFRKQAHSLALVTQHVLGKNPTIERILFVFTNKRKTAVKLLYFDQTGYALWSKILEKDRFRWPKSDPNLSSKMLTIKQLKWLLEGIDIDKIKMHQKIILD